MNMYYYLELTSIRPQPVGRKAKQQTMRSLRERWQMSERVTIVATTPMKRKALNSRNAM